MLKEHFCMLKYVCQKSYERSKLIPIFMIMIKKWQKAPLNCVIITIISVSDEKQHEYSLSCILFHSQAQRQYLMVCCVKISAQYILNTQNVLAQEKKTTSFLQTVYNIWLFFLFLNKNKATVTLLFQKIIKVKDFPNPISQRFLGKKQKKETYFNLIYSRTMGIARC